MKVPSSRQRSCRTVSPSVSRSCRTGELMRCRPCACRCWTECRPELSVNGLTCCRSRASPSSWGHCDGVSWSDGRLWLIVAASDWVLHLQQDWAHCSRLPIEVHSSNGTSGLLQDSTTTAVLPAAELSTIS